MRKMTVVNQITAAIEEKEAVMGNLPLEEANHLAGTTNRSARTIRSGHIARISTLPVAAQLQTTRRSIVAVRDLLMALFATRKRMEDPNMTLNTEQFVFYG